MNPNNAYNHMNAAITCLEIQLEALENNGPIHLAEGDTERAEKAAKEIMEIQEALLLLRRTQESGKWLRNLTPGALRGAGLKGAAGVARGLWSGPMEAAPESVKEGDPAPGEPPLAHCALYELGMAHERTAKLISDLPWYAGRSRAALIEELVNLTCAMDNIIPETEAEREDSDRAWDNLRKTLGELRSMRDRLDTRDGEDAVRAERVNRVVRQSAENYRTAEEVAIQAGLGKKHVDAQGSPRTGPEDAWARAAADAKEAQRKPFDVTDIADAKAKVPDIKVVGDGDMFRLICKASSERQGWMKSTKAMEVTGGCVVQVTTQQGDSVAEALAYVPGVRIAPDNNGGHRLVGMSWQDELNPSARTEKGEALEESRSNSIVGVDWGGDGKNPEPEGNDPSAGEDLFGIFLDVLNSAYEADPTAMHALICNRVPCKDELANHPTVVVEVNRVTPDESYTVGLLGVLNGICQRVTGRRVAVMFSDQPDGENRHRILGFREYTVPGEP